MLRYTAYDIPSLENKFRNLSNDIIDLEIKKRKNWKTLSRYRIRN
jgi:hypothetical protein